MGKHEVVIHENTSATQESAPYLGVYISKETVKLDCFAAAVGAKCGLPAIQVIAILGGCFDAFEELERETLVRIHTDIGCICGIITGSFPTSDAVFNPEENALELTLRLPDEIKLELADVIATIVTDETIAKVRVDNIADVETPRPYNLIHGQHVFRVAGYNLSMEDEGATVFLQNAIGTTFHVVIDEVISKQLFTGHSEALLEGGDYKLVVKSRGGDAEGPLQTSFRKVKYLKVMPSATVSFIGTDGLEDGHVSSDDDLTIRGQGLKLGPSDVITIATEGSEPMTATVEDLTANTDELVKVNYQSKAWQFCLPDKTSQVTIKGVTRTVVCAN